MEWWICRQPLTASGLKTDKMEQENLVSGLHNEIVRVKELLKEYEAIPAGRFAAPFLRMSIKQAEEALASGDAVDMLRYYQDLTHCN